MSKRVGFDTMDPEAVRAYLQRVADDNYPTHQGGELAIRTALGPVVISIGPAPSRSAGASKSGEAKCATR